MRPFGLMIVVLAGVYSLHAQDAHPALGVATATRPFSVGPVETKPEAGPVSVVDGDQVSAPNAPVAFRLTGENRAVLGNGSAAVVRGLPDNGAYFYLSKGDIQYDARQEHLAICALDRLYVPSRPGSGTVTIVGKKVQVKLTTGTMVSSGSEACDVKAVPLLLTSGAGAVGAAGAAAGTAAATATATAGAAGAAGAASITVPVVVTAAVAVGAAAGAAVVLSQSQAPASQSPITPGQ